MSKGGATGRNLYRESRTSRGLAPHAPAIFRLPFYQTQRSEAPSRSPPSLADKASVCPRNTSQVRFPYASLSLLPWPMEASCLCALPRRAHHVCFFTLLCLVMFVSRAGSRRVLHCFSSHKVVKTAGAASSSALTVRGPGNLRVTSIAAADVEFHRGHPVDRCSEQCVEK